MIVSQELLPGYPLVESTFVQMLGVSRTPIRNAIQLLQKDGLVEVIANKGAFVKLITQNEILWCFQYCEALEGMSAYLVTEKYNKGEITRDCLKTIEEHHYSTVRAVEKESLAEWKKCDYDFHAEFARLCGNPYIYTEHTRLRDRLLCVLWFIAPYYALKGSKEASLQEHATIMDALFEKKPSKARYFAQNHRGRVCNELKKLFEG